MNIAEQIGNFIEDNTTYKKGVDLFLNYLPEDVKKGLVVRFISSYGKKKLKTADIAIYYIDKDWALGNRLIRELRELMVTHRGLSGTGWSVFDDVEIGNEGLDELRRQVTSLNFKVGFVEE